MRKNLRIFAVLFIIQSLISSSAYGYSGRNCLAPESGLQSLAIEHSLVLMQKEQLQSAIQDISDEIKKLRAYRAELLSEIKQNIRAAYKLQRENYSDIRVYSVEELVDQIFDSAGNNYLMGEAINTVEQMNQIQALFAVKISELEKDKNRLSAEFRQAKKHLLELERRQEQKKAALRTIPAALPSTPSAVQEPVKTAEKPQPKAKADIPAKTPEIEKPAEPREKAIDIQTNKQEVFELLHSPLLADIADMDEPDPVGRLAQLIAYKNNQDWTDPLIISSLSSSIRSLDTDLTPLFSLFKQATTSTPLLIRTPDNKQYQILVRNKLTIQEQNIGFIRIKLELFLQSPDHEKSRFNYKKSNIRGELYYAQAGNKVVVFRFIPERSAIVIVDMHTLQKSTVFIAKLLRFTPQDRDPDIFNDELIAAAQPLLIRSEATEWTIDEQNMAILRSPEQKLSQLITEKFFYNTELSAAWLEKSSRLAGVSSLAEALDEKQLSALGDIDISGFISRLAANPWTKNAEKIWQQLSKQKNSFTADRSELESLFYLFDLAAAEALNQSSDRTKAIAVFPVRDPNGAIISFKNNTPFLMPEEYFSGITSLIKSTVAVIPVTSRGKALLCLPKNQPQSPAEQKWTIIEAQRGLKTAEYSQSILETAAQALREQLFSNAPEQIKAFEKHMTLKEFAQDQPFGDMIDLGSYRGIPITRKLNQTGLVFAFFSKNIAAELQSSIDDAEFDTARYKAFKFFPWPTIVQEADERGPQTFLPGLLRIIRDKGQEDITAALKNSLIRLQSNPAREHLLKYMFSNNKYLFNDWIENRAAQQAADSGKTWLEFIADSANWESDPVIKNNGSRLENKQLLLQSI